METEESSDPEKKTLIWDKAVNSLNSSENYDLKSSTNCKNLNENSDKVEDSADNAEDVDTASILEMLEDAENDADLESIEVKTALDCAEYTRRLK